MRRHGYLLLAVLFGLSLSACAKVASLQPILHDMQPSSIAMPTTQTPLESTNILLSEPVFTPQSNDFSTAIAGEVYFLVDGTSFRLQHKAVQQDGRVFLSLQDICAAFAIEDTLLLPSVTLLDDVKYMEVSHLESHLTVTVEVYDYANLYVSIYQREPLFGFYLDGNAGYIDNQGAVILEGAHDTRDYSNGLGCVDNRYYVNADGETILIVPDGYTAFPFSGGLAAVFCHETEAIGFIDLCGNIVIEFQHPYDPEHIPEFHEGIACVYSGGDSYFINTDGIVIGKISDMAGFDGFSWGRLVTLLPVCAVFYCGFCHPVFLRIRD